jgi:hypothetical protein
MVFYCSLCEKETAVFSRFCESCTKLKRIGNVYGFDKCLKILEICCIRNDEQIDRKIEYIKKNNKKVYGDDSKDYDNK